MDVAPEKHRASRRGQQVLDALVDSKLATPEAVQTVLNIADPFPDDTCQPSGWPDGHGTVTLPVKWESQVQISAPAGLLATETWDAHIIFMPVLGQATDVTQKWSLANANGVLTPVAGGGATVNTFACVTAKTGTLPEYGTLAWDTAEAYNCGPTEVINGNASRICAAGIEAVASGPDIYRGGMGYAYRFDSSAEAAVRSPITTAVSPVPYAARVQKVVMQPPIDPGDVINYANTYSGDAKRGIVSVACPRSSKNEFNMPFPSEHMMYKYNLSGSSLYQVTASTPMVEWCTSGIFLTGLHPNATYTIKNRVFLELSPVIGQSTVGAGNLAQVAARQAVPSSAEAMDVISGILSRMPAGFDYAENPLGEWFSKVLSTVASVAPAIGKAIGNVVPGAGLIGSGIGALARGASSAVGGKSSAQQQKKKPTVKVSSAKSVAKKSASSGK